MYSADPEDYVGFSNQLVILSSVSSRMCVSISIITDLIVENVESFNVAISTADQSVVDILIANAQVNILDSTCK